MTSPFDFATPIGCINARPAPELWGRTLLSARVPSQGPFVTASPNLGTRCIMDERELANRVVDIVDQTAYHIAPRRILAVHRDLRFGRRRTPGTSMLLAVSIRRFC